ncbi:MAG: hypothetical protein AVDCRST_MAG68-4216 [uncultured Gemmatimonadetes bacterium]|uniref:Uncharacterized protein n=1 Tax=uncultured Gemmatimonadota bacterium TaxID=203437 RepID=A0A6J4MIK9_9BACT|nr:MAG: hypothetical protein AVDCRST_MAG68-4216 [uncultured Gemmatimonadota bacterium]
MLVRGMVFAALLLLAPAAAAAQWREPPLPRFAPALAAESSPGPARVPSGARAAGPVRHALLGALAGAVTGFGAYLIAEETTPHTDHSYDSLARFSTVAVGAAVGTVAGLVVYAVRNR